jgi:hypothetical protein
MEEEMNELTRRAADPTHRVVTREEWLIARVRT